MEIVKWGNGRHTAPLERAITSGLKFCLVAWLTTQCGPHKVGRRPSHPHADASHQRQSLLFTATNNRSRRMFTWVRSTAWNSPQPSLSHNHIDLCAAENSLSPYEDSWLQWLSDNWGGGGGGSACQKSWGEGGPSQQILCHLLRGEQLAGSHQSKGGIASSHWCENLSVKLWLWLGSFCRTPFEKCSIEFLSFCVKYNEALGLFTPTLFGPF